MTIPDRSRPVEIGRKTSPSIPPGYHRIRRGRMGMDQFTQIRNAVFRDARLSAKAMGVFGHISTHQDGFGVTPDTIAKHMRDGVSAIQGALRELEACGYLVRRRVRNKDGTLGGSIYEITDEPAGETVRDEQNRRSNPGVENPQLDHPPVDNRTPKKTNTTEDQQGRKNSATCVAGSPLRGDRDHGDKNPTNEPSMPSWREMIDEEDWTGIVERIEDEVDGFEGCEEQTTRSMLDGYTHPKAVINKILADRRQAAA